MLAGRCARRKMTLYKYLPQKYVNSFIKKGEILFRNLSYFRKYNDVFRGDLYEGMHRDSPDTGATITNLTTGKIFKGKYTFINEVEYDEIYIFCLSMSCSAELFDKFECDSCIEITDSESFIKKIRNRILSYKSTSKEYGFLSDKVRYYHPNLDDLSDIDIHDPKVIPFLKDFSFEEQNEFRLVYGRGKKCNSITKKIALPTYKYNEDDDKYQSNSFVIPIGNIEQLCRVIYK